MNFLKRLFCRHENRVYITTLYGDAINHRNGTRTLFKCTQCGKLIYER